MLNKELIKKKFQKSLLTYNSNASIQKIMADELLFYIKKSNFKNILEIGSFTGVLTQKTVLKFPDFVSYKAIDIIPESEEYLRKIDNRIEFLNTDIEEFDSKQKFDLIITSASLQWCSDFCKVLKKLKEMLSKGGVLAVSVFSKENLYEIKNVFNVGLEYPAVDEIQSILPCAQIVEKKYELKFKSAKKALEHLKKTGVNAISESVFSYCELKEKMQKLNDIYNNKITYFPLYIIYSAN